jgi:hypothetical protein
MGFREWQYALGFILMFACTVSIPCFLLATIGSKMFNDMGNFPSRANEFQMKALWKLAAVEIGALLGLSVIFLLFN